MAYAGQKFQNPKNGEQVELLETSKETAGKYVRFKAILKTGGGFEVNHVHPTADEIIEVVSGTLSYKLDGKTFKAHAGEKITLPCNQSHAHWNADADDLEIIQTISPCGDADRFLETLFGLSTDGKLDSKGQPPFLQVMVWLRHLDNKTYLADLPRGLQNFLAIVLSPVAKWLGYQPFYAKYEK